MSLLIEVVFTVYALMSIGPKMAKNVSDCKLDDSVDEQR